MSETYERAKVRENLDRLEREVDAAGLSGVLGILATVCSEKAEHLRSNWQDDASAREWDRAAAKLEKLAAALPM